IRAAMNTAQTIDSPSLGTIIQSAGGILIVGLQTWQVRTLNGLRDEVRALRQHLFGLTGSAGLNGDVEELKKRAYLWDKELGDHATRLVAVDHVTDCRRD